MFLNKGDSLAVYQVGSLSREERDKAKEHDDGLVNTKLVHRRDERQVDVGQLRGQEPLHVFQAQRRREHMDRRIDPPFLRFHPERRDGP